MLEVGQLQKKHRKKIINVLFLLIVFVLTLWSVFYGEDVSQVISYLKDADKRYLFLGVGCVIGFILGEAAVIYYLLGTLGSRVSFFHCSLYSFIGFFYSCITPSASGGQPMQVIAMRKDKIPVAVSTVVLAIVTITYKLVLVILGIGVLLFRPKGLMVHLEGTRTIIYLGLGLNIIFVGLLLLLVFHPNLVRKMADGFFGWIHRIRPFHNFEKRRAWLTGVIDQYHGTAEFYKTHMVVIWKVFLITLLQRCLLFLITWFTYQALHLSGAMVTTVVLLQAMISAAADMLPLPGGMGVSENLFLLIFKTIFGDSLVLAGMVISRGISYYAQLLISGVMTVAASFVIREGAGEKGSKRGRKEL